MRWYQTWWGVVLLVLVSAIIVGGVAFAIFIGRYWWEIKQGRGESLQEQVNSELNNLKVNNENKNLQARVDLELSTSPSLGNAKAETVIVEFVDYKCPKCKAEEPIVRQLVQKFGNQIKLIVRQFPIESLHPGANKLAVIAICAEEQGLFWQAHRWFFDNQDSLGAELTEADLKNISDQLGMNLIKLQKCFTNPTSGVKVNRDYADGIRYGVQGTPTFFVNGTKIEGVIPFADWSSLLNKN